MVGCVTGSQGTHISFPAVRGLASVRTLRTYSRQHCPNHAVTQRSAAQIEPPGAFLTFNDFPQFLLLNNGLQTKSTLRDITGLKLQPQHSTTTCKLNPFSPASVTSKRCIYIFIQQIQVLNVLNMVYTLRFFSSKCSLFHNSNVFGSCIIHILYRAC